MLALLYNALAKQGHARNEQRLLCESDRQLSWISLTISHVHAADTEIASRAGCHDLLGFRVMVPGCWRRPAPAQGILLALHQVDSLPVGRLSLFLDLHAC